MPKVSVIVPVYNAGLFIERCVRSLFEQTLEDIEYIFVDDCSPDNSMDILLNVMEEYPHRKPNVTIMRHEVNTGQSGARKTGMHVAKGEYIIHCDADDWVDVDMYERMYRLAVEKDVEAVCCDIVLECDGFSRVLKCINEYEDHQLMFDCIAPISVEYFSMCNRLVSRKVYERQMVDPYEGVNMWDDVGLSIRVRYYVHDTAVINEPFYHYNRINMTSTTKRPLLDRLNEQVACVNHIENFFKKENDIEKYSLFISYLKLHTKEDIFSYDAGLWLNTFKEVRKDIWRLRNKFRPKYVRRYYALIYGGFLGKLIWKIFWKK
jgi:glycosyltransferase involved in cell wall biosynthesis